MGELPSLKVVTAVPEMMLNSKPSYMMAAEAARMVGVTRRTIHRMVHRDEIRVADVTTEGYLLFTQADVEAAAKYRREHPPHMGRPRKHPKPEAKASAAKAHQQGTPGSRSKKGTKRKRRATKTT